MSNMSDVADKPMSVRMNVDSSNKVWLTPRWIIGNLGRFDLDPCCPPVMPWATADRMMSLPTAEAGPCPEGFVRTDPGDGLKENWDGLRVFVNPPYGTDSYGFIRKFTRHASQGGEGILLIFARLETEIWQKVIFPSPCDSVFFVAGRVQFHHADGTPSGINAPAPVALVAASKFDSSSIRGSGISGTFVSVDTVIGGKGVRP